MLSVKQSEAYFTETVKITVNGKWIAYVVSTGLTIPEVNAKVNGVITFRPERLLLPTGNLVSTK